MVGRLIIRIEDISSLLLREHSMRFELRRNKGTSIVEPYLVVFLVEDKVCLLAI